MRRSPARLREGASFMNQHIRIGILLTAAASLGWAQTKVDLRTQSKSVDFSAATTTKPLKTGTVLPVTCGLGELFYKTDAAAGVNLYGCTATNSWTQEGGSGGATASVSDNFKVLQTGPSSITIGASCSPSSPCNARFGGLVYRFTSMAAATVNSGTGTILVYISSAGSIVVGNNLNVSCTALCVAQSGVTAFPIDSIPVFTWTVTNGVLDLLGGSDSRAFLSTKNVLPGTGLTTLENNGATLLSVDQAVVGLRFPAPATSATPCTTGSWATNGAFFYVCVSTNLWNRVALTSW